MAGLRHIISVNRNLSFFSTGYSYLIQLIPVVIVAPLFISGEVEFGVVGRSAMAFATLLGAFSLIITQFQAISSDASVVSRLSEFVDHAARFGDPETKWSFPSPAKTTPAAHHPSGWGKLDARQAAPPDSILKTFSKPPTIRP